jgi:hypothetical protein
MGPYTKILHAAEQFGYAKDALMTNQTSLTFHSSRAPSLDSDFFGRVMMMYSLLVVEVVIPIRFFRLEVSVFLDCPYLLVSGNKGNARVPHAYALYSSIV